MVAWADGVSYRGLMRELVRYDIGDIQVTVVSDGEVRLDAGAVFGLVPRVMWEPIVGRENLDDEHRITMGLNCLLVRSGDDLLLVETGMGNKLVGSLREKVFPGEYGTLMEAMLAAGVRASDVTAVANTHLHADHCGWNTVKDYDRLRPTFPNARYYIDAGEYEAAMNPNERTKATYLRENFEPLEKAGQLDLIEGETEIVPGVRFIPTPGHTADHAALVISSKGSTGYYLGDMVQHAAHIELVPWISAFDVLPLVSLETKKTIAERAIRENALLMCTHAPYPGAGRLTESGGRRTYTPE